MSVYRAGNRGTMLGGAEYNVQEACVKLYNAMKGLGTNELEVINVLAAHTTEGRIKIKKKYQVKYGKDLIKELDSELSFSFGKLVLALFVEPEEFVLQCIHQAVSSVSGKKSRGGKLLKRLSSFFKEGLMGPEGIVIGLLCARSNSDLKAIKKAFKKKYGDSLEEKMATDGNNMPHDVVSFILDMISGDRDEDDEVDLEHVKEDCEALAEAKSEDVLHELLHDRSFKHLRAVFKECAASGGKTVEGMIDDLNGVVSKELQAAYRGVVTLIQDGEAVYWADRIRAAVEGAGTDDDSLVKILVLRAEVDMVDIMEAYERKYKISMADEVADDTGGDYKELISRILTKPSPLMLAKFNGTEETMKKKQKRPKAEEVANEEILAVVETPVEEQPLVKEIQQEEATVVSINNAELIPETEPEDAPQLEEIEAETEPNEPTGEKSEPEPVEEEEAAQEEQPEGEQIETVNAEQTEEEMVPDEITEVKAEDAQSEVIETEAESEQEKAEGEPVNKTDEAQAENEQTEGAEEDKDKEQDEEKQEDTPTDAATEEEQVLQAENDPETNADTCADAIESTNENKKESEE